MSIFRRRVYETIGGFDEALRTNEDYDFWLRAALAGFRFWRNDEPLGHYRRRDDSLSAIELRMIRGILRVYRKARPAAVPGGRPSSRSSTARSRDSRPSGSPPRRDASLEAGDFEAAGDHLRALHERRGGATIRAAGLMARWAPRSAVDCLQHPPDASGIRISGATGAIVMKYSVVIATYNRAADLRQTLASLAGLRPDGPWEVIVVDNNSPDDTRAVVEQAAATFPVELRYLFEREQGRSPALNTGIRAARGDIIATTDDDVRVPADWLNRAAEGLRAVGLRLRRRPRAADLGRDRARPGFRITAASNGP